jgi:hypothetical protein
MPRDFVPCLYTERALPNVEEYGMVTRCEVIECFVGEHVATHDRLFTMSLDSHAFFRDAAAHDLVGTRWTLFGEFYAAMAALE